MSDTPDQPKTVTLSFTFDAFCAAVAITFTILLLQDALLYL